MIIHKDGRRYLKMSFQPPKKSSTPSEDELRRKEARDKIEHMQIDRECRGQDLW